MNILIVTGTSRGIGKAILELFCEKDDYFIISIGRKKIRKDKVFHLYMDFSLISDKSLQKFAKILLKKIEVFLPDKVVFVNNAATIKPIKKIHKISFYDILTNLNINILSQILLLKSFINCTYPISSKKIIINLSSGAGYRPIFGWSLYCTSKTAINMFMQCIKQEYEDFTVINYDPGVVDTDMQKTIRLASEDDFPLVRIFRDYKKKKMLKKTGDIAQEIGEIVDSL